LPLKRRNEQFSYQISQSAVKIQLSTHKLRHQFTMTLKKIYLILLLLLPAHAWLQCTQQVTHLSGTQTVGCTEITVTSTTPYSGSYFGYCDQSTQPYYIGQDVQSGISGDGSFTFTFNPPVSAATLNFSAISNDEGGLFNEMVVLYVNGSHYAVPAVGTPNGCEPLSEITPEGNIAGPGSGTGFNGLTITGPITTLTVKDSVTLGMPAGDLFSLFICSSPNNFSIELGNDTTVCEGAIIILDPDSGNAALTWEDGSTGPTFEVTASGTYSVEGVLDGCGASDSITVTYISPVIDLGNDFTLCDGETILLDPQAGNAALTWQDSSMGPTFLVVSPGTYSVDALIDGCPASDEILISEDSSSIELGNDLTLCDGDSLLLLPVASAGLLTWQDGSHDLFFLADTAGVYTVDVLLAGCTASDSIVIAYTECESGGELEMPNVFSPDGDGLNDTFIPVKLEGITEATLLVLNRWGNKVFSGNLAAGWDGRSDGNPVSEGVYFYQVDYRAADGNTKKTEGSVTVVR
jgi:gliding motility-associated-like protein